MANNFAKGLNIYGIPVFPESGGRPATGKRYFVCSVSGVDEVTAYGKSPDAPFATIDYAINQCTTKGDIIYVMENHAETVNSTGDLVPDVAGVQILGLGQKNTRPIISLNSTFIKPKANILISGAGTRFSNIVFRQGTTGMGTTNIGIKVNANDVKIDNCRLDVNSCQSTFSFPIYIGSTATNGGYDRVSIEDNEIINQGATKQGNTGIYLRSTGSTALHNRIVGNTVMGVFRGNGAIAGSTKNSMQDLLVADNTIYQGTTVIARGYGINFQCTAISKRPGMIANNLICVASSGGATQVNRWGTLQLLSNRFSHTTGVLGKASLGFKFSAT